MDQLTPPHLDPERLAELALEADGSSTPSERAHLEGCTHCRAELADLTEVVGLTGRTGSADLLSAPVPDLWQRIRTELGSELAPGPTSPAGASPVLGSAPATSAQASSSHPTSSHPTSDGPGAHRETVAPTLPGSAQLPAGRRRRVVLAAAVGVVVGVLGTLGVVRALSPADPPDSPVVARSTLEALPGETGSGSAELLRTPGGPVLQVSVDTPTDADSYRELWLIHRDGRQLFSLGNLPTSGVGTFPLPPALADGLDGYVTVDVSTEPYDGNPAHSTQSLVRGTLT